MSYLKLLIIPQHVVQGSVDYSFSVCK